MKKTIFCSAAILALAFSACNKAETSKEPVGIPMALVATLGPDTKVSYTDDPANNVMKTAWEAGDKVSVLSIKSGAPVANDIFTTTSGDGIFTGIYKGGDAPDAIIIYPALSDEDSNGWKNDILYRIKAGNASFEYWKYINNPKQAEADSPSHLKDCMLLTGDADMTDLASNTLSATLSAKAIILKINVKFSSAKTVTAVQIDALHSDDSDYDCFGSTVSWGSYADFYPQGSGVARYIISLDPYVSAAANATVSFFGAVYPFDNSENKISFAAGDKLKISVDSETIEKTFTAAKTLEAGKLYTINVTLP